MFREIQPLLIGVSAEFNHSGVKLGEILGSF
jgi:hypothetical protein